MYDNFIAGEVKVSGVPIGNFLCLVRYKKLYIFCKVVMPTTEIEYSWG